MAQSQYGGQSDLSDKPISMKPAERSVLVKSFASLDGLASVPRARYCCCR